MLVVGAQALPNQTMQAALGGQAVTLNIYQTQYELAMDVLAPGMLNGGLFGVICQNLNRIVRDAYLGFVGDLVWLDTQGATDPIYTGIGGRYQLIYLTQSDLEAAGFSG